MAAPASYLNRAQARPCLIAQLRNDTGNNPSDQSQLDSGLLFSELRFIKAAGK